MSSISYVEPFPPFPGWKRMVYSLPRPVTEEDVAAFVRDQELYCRETSAGEVWIVHKFGIVEIHILIGARAVEAWFDPEKSALALEYLTSLMETRF